MPGHTNAALSSYAELNCNGQAPPPFTGTDVGFSAMCVEMDFTYLFIDDVVKEIAAMTKGPYFHMGGDEVKTLTPAQYRAFVERVQTIIQAHGKQMIGWDEVAATTLLPTSIVQHWRPDAAHGELGRAPHLILSPGNRAYLDMKYDRDTALGLNWAGLIPVKTAYDWDPATLVPEAPAAAILGRRGAALVRDAGEHPRRRVPRDAPARGDRGARLVAGGHARLGTVPRAPRRAGPAVGINCYRRRDTMDASIAPRRFGIRHSALTTVVLVSTYDLGRQPFGLASPAAWLRGAGHDVHCVDLTRTKLPEDAVKAAALVAFYLPMHTATRLALAVMDRVRALNPAVHICAYGLYAPLNADILREHGVQTILGPEFEAEPGGAWQHWLPPERTFRSGVSKAGPDG